jgi:hypothetical protein
MKKTLFVLFAVLTVLGFSSSTLATYASTPQPVPHHGHYYGPYPYAPQPFPYPAPVPYYPGLGHVTCYAQGLANGAYFYGVALNIPAAQNWALHACHSSGQYCQLLGCRW